MALAFVLRIPAEARSLYSASNWTQPGVRNHISSFFRRFQTK